MFPLRPSTRSQAASGPDNLQKARSVAGTLPKRYFSQAVEPALRESLLWHDRRCLFRVDERVSAFDAEWSSG